MSYPFRILLPLFLSLSCTALIAQSEQPAPSVTPALIYRIRGVVVSSVGEAPVSHAHLNATPAMMGRARFGARFPSSGITADADEHGRFELTLPSPGAWHLTASAAGFATQAFEEHDNFSSAVVLTRADPAIDLRFRLAPEAEITGTVLDEAGEAVRNARVTLQHRPASSPEGKDQPFRTRMTAMTDDRGVYDFGDLTAGDYRILVDTKPWYSAASQPRGITFSSTDSPPPDPTLDVTYQLTWYPGVDDPDQAEILSLKPAETRHADFHLVPIPAIHLQMPSPAQTEGNRNIPVFPFLERIDTAGNTPTGFSQATMTGSRNQIDVGGLAPGLYRMRLQGQDRSSQTSIVQIVPGSSRVVDLSAVTAPTANISINMDDDQEDRSAGVELRNLETGRRFSSLETRAFMAPSFRRDPPENQPQQQQVSLQVPPGRYKVFLTGRRNTYLTGITAKGAEVSGRIITVRTGDVILTLHSATGFASINGMATTNDKPVVGAMVLLVPAGLGNPGSIDFLLRDQTNTDGSFDLNDILPGQYILIAIDHGWDINWKDSSTLARYLTQGIPLDLHPNATLKQNIQAQTP